LKLLPPDKEGERRIEERKGEKGRELEGKGMKGKERKRTFERSHSSKFVTTALVHGSIFSERELMFMSAICRRPSVCRLSVVCRLSSVVCLSSFCNVRAPYSAD